MRKINKLSSETNKSMSGETVWLYINQLKQKKRNLFGLLIHFAIEDMHWKLNYRGDAPLLQFHTNGVKHVLQVDGDLFFPTKVKLASSEYEEEIFDAFLMPMEEILNFINTMFYEDLELDFEDEDDEREIYEDTREEYDLFYHGDNEEGFQRIFDKMMNWDVIEEMDVVELNK